MTNTENGNDKSPAADGVKQSGWLKRAFIDPITRTVNPPWYDARGIAIGLFVGIGVPLGLHMVSLALLRFALRYNVVVAFAFTFVNNPITLIPMYYGFYWWGSHLTGTPPAMTIHDFRHLMDPIIQAPNFWEAVQRFMSLGVDLLFKWAVGAMLFAGIVSVTSYFISYWLLMKRCLRHARKVGVSYKKLVGELEQSLAEKSPTTKN